MKLKKLNPVTNGSRFTIKLQKNLLSKNSRVVRSILSKNITYNGRSSVNGRITVWHKGGGVKHLYRGIDFLNKCHNSNSVVLTNCYDPNRNAFITLNYELIKKNFFFNIAPHSVFPGSLIKNSLEPNEIKLGFRTTLKNIPAGSIIHNLTINNKLKTQYIRAAGTFGQLVQCGAKTAQIKLPSKKIIEVSSENYATLGIISNLQSNLTVLGKAGVNRRLGIRPTTRGIAMNPVDHPHGGRTNGGMRPVSPWGVPTKSGFYLRKKK